MIELQTFAVTSLYWRYCYIGYDPANYVKYFQAAVMFENWTVVNDGRICQDGKLVNFNELDGDDVSFKKFWKKRRYLKIWDYALLLFRLMYPVLNRLKL